MGLYSGGLIIGRIFASEIWGAYFREGLFIYLFIYLIFFFLAGGGGGLFSEFYGISGRQTRGLICAQFFRIQLLSIHMHSSEFYENISRV